MKKKMDISQILTHCAVLEPEGLPPRVVVLLDHVAVAGDEALVDGADLDRHGHLIHLLRAEDRHLELGALHLRVLLIFEITENCAGEGRGGWEGGAGRVGSERGAHGSGGGGAALAAAAAPRQS